MLTYAATHTPVIHHFFSEQGLIKYANFTYINDILRGE